MRLDLYTCGCPYARRVAVYLLGACIPAGCDDGIPTRITFPHIHLTHIQKDHSIRYKKYRLCLKWSLRHNKYPSTYIYIYIIYIYIFGIGIVCWFQERARYQRMCLYLMVYVVMVN